MEHLPSINLRVETVRLAFGSLMRLCLHSFVYYFTRGVFSQYVLRRKGSLAMWERQSFPYVASLGMEIGISVLICPVRYLAAVTTPRFILDYTMTGWSEVLCKLDRFSPGNFATYALHAFTSQSEWNFDFFTWQLPSVSLTLAKLFYRRHRHGSQACPTRRVLFLLLPLQLLLRAYLATFAVMLPTTGGEAGEAIVAAVLEGMLTSSLARHSWPWGEAETNNNNNINNISNSEGGRSSGSEEVQAKCEEVA